MNTIIRKIRPEEHDLLREFLYQAIYLPEGMEPPPWSVVDLPELQVYIADFGTRPGDHGLVAEVEKKSDRWGVVPHHGGLRTHRQRHPLSGHLVTAGVSRAGHRDTAIE